MLLKAAHQSEPITMACIASAGLMELHSGTDKNRNNVRYVMFRFRLWEIVRRDHGWMEMRPIKKIEDLLSGTSLSLKSMSISINHDNDLHCTGLKKKRNVLFAAHMHFPPVIFVLWNTRCNQYVGIPHRQRTLGTSAPPSTGDALLQAKGAPSPQPEPHLRPSLVEAKGSRACFPSAELGSTLLPLAPCWGFGTN